MRSRLAITLGLHSFESTSRSPTGNRHNQFPGCALLPKDDYFLEGLLHCNKHYYSLPGQTADSPELLFDNFSTPLHASVGDEFQIWFTEDLYKCGHEDNGSGKTCVLIFGLFV